MSSLPMEQTTDSASPSTSRSLSLPERLFRKLVLRRLAPMQRGRLSMQMPDRSQLHFGTAPAPQAPHHGVASMVIRDERFFRRCVLYGDIGFAESYLAGEWTTENLEAIIVWFILNAKDAPQQWAGGRRGSTNALQIANRLRHRLRGNSRDGSRRNIEAHYDLSNEFFALFLDESMTYSGALFEQENQSLESAQIAKYDRLCRRLHLQRGDRVLEIGGGWGAFSRYAATHYGCHVTSLTISPSQYEHAAREIERTGLGSSIDLQLRDYREMTGQFDKIVSIEMLEAVGHQHLPSFFRKCHELLTPSGLLGLQYITCPDSRYERLRRGVDFIQKHIFPGSLILSIGAVGDAIRATSDLALHHLDDLGSSYVRTLHVWHQRFNQNLTQVRALGFDESFIRKWNYYLQYCSGAFAMRHTSVVQAVYSRPNNLTLPVGAPWEL